MDLHVPKDEKPTVYVYANDGTKYTNNHGLSKAVVAAILKDRYNRPGEKKAKYSASTLTTPTQQVILLRENPDKLLIRDVVSLFYAFMGSVAHQVLEDAHEEEHGGFVEKRLYTEIDGISISGMMDKYKEPVIGDYKSCKVYKIQKAKFIDWENQLNVYAYLCRIHDMPVEEIHIEALIFDWKAHEVYKENYPKSPIVQIDIPVWSLANQRSYIESRVNALETAKQHYDVYGAGGLALDYPCTKEEMWMDLKDVVVMKKGGSRAINGGVCKTREEAAIVMSEKGLTAETHEIVERWTDRTRCKQWCDVAHLCEQNKALFAEEGEDFEAHYNL